MSTHNVMKKTILTAVLCALPILAYAIPQIISYQGKLNDKNGVPVQGNVTMTFAIYSSPSGTTSLWNETQAINVSSGIFKVELGSVQSIPDTVFIKDSLYLGIQIGSDTEMVPRQRITSGAFAYKAKTVEVEVPIGAILAWAKNLSVGLTLPRGWVECSGQVLNDAESPLNGIAIPDLNGIGGIKSFLRGSSTSGTVGGADNHTHWVEVGAPYGGSNSYGAGTGKYNGHQHNGTTTSSSNLPSFYEVVWIMKIK